MAFAVPALWACVESGPSLESGTVFLGGTPSAHARWIGYKVDMDYTHLGRTGLSVSRLCLGTMNFGPLTPPTESHQIMDRAHELGINFFDTANRYGGMASPPGQLAKTNKAHAGWTEEIIGDWFAGGGGRRERTVLATKVYGAMGEWPNDGKLSALSIRRACEDSLRRLQTDHIDLYQMHHVDRDTSWEEIWQAMGLLIEQGKVLYVGSSNFAAWDIVRANEEAARRNILGLVSEQSIYNLMTRDIEPRGSTGGAPVWCRRHPLESPARVVCSAEYSARRAGAVRPADPGKGWRPTGTGSKPTRSSAPHSARTRRTSPSPGCYISRG